MSRIFEDVIAEYLRGKEHYNTTTRFVPKYLGKEIDVFGERGSRNNKEIIICECKFRFEDRMITKEELEYFVIKSNVIKKNEGKNEQIKFNFWFVTNTRNIESEAKKYLKRTNLRFMVAKLPTNWRKQANWSVNQITEVFKK